MLAHRQRLDWVDVVTGILAREAHLLHKKIGADAAGYSSVAAWRTAMFAVIRGLNAMWELFSVPDPLVEIPTWHGGPFKEWEHIYYRGRIMPTFGELANDPEPTDAEETATNWRRISVHPYVQGLVQAFPSPTIVVALRQADGRITVIEGMYRCAAIAVASTDKELRKLFETTLFVALGNIGHQVVPTFGKY